MLDPHTLIDDGVYNLADDLDHPAHPSQWKRSSKGSLWRIYRHVTLTLFRGKRGGFCICIAGPKKIGQKFYDLGAAKPEDALRECIRKTDQEIMQNSVLKAYVKSKEGQSHV